MDSGTINNFYIAFQNTLENVSGHRCSRRRVMVLHKSKTLPQVNSIYDPWKVFKLFADLDSFL